MLSIDGAHGQLLWVSVVGEHGMWSGFSGAECVTVKKYIPPEARRR